MLFVDLEVYSDVNITKAPMDVYANHPSTKIILACCAEDDGPVMTYEHPYDILKWMADLRNDRSVPLNAWNVGYERTIISAKHFHSPLSRWTDTMVLARYLGLPGGLKQCCQALSLPEETSTKSEKALIKKFCMPYDGKPATADEWSAFVTYCQQDVKATRAIYRKLMAEYSFPESEVRRIWELDALINSRGLPIDVTTSTFAASEVVRLAAEVKETMRGITGLDNPNSVQQLLPWLQKRGYPHDSLGKEYVQQAIDRDGDKVTPEGLRVLRLRLSAAKSSVKKFAALVEGTSPDNRLRNQFKYLGAHTARWSGRGVQPQNLTRTPGDLEALDKLIRREPSESLDELSLQVRPMIAAHPGKKLIVSDLSAIENRALMWLAGCESGLAVYADGRDPYKDFATRLYKCSYEDVSKQQRQVCKPAVLGCGYGLGSGMLKTLPDGRQEYTGLMAYASSMGVALSPDQSRGMVRTFRNSFCEVVDYWRYLERAFHAAVETGETQKVGVITFGAIVTKTEEIEAVYIELPSGRRIHYMHPQATWKGVRGAEIRFNGQRNNHWCMVSTWGGSLAENVVQAVSRDVLVEGMLRAEKQGLTVVGHCHDEIICEEPEGTIDAVAVLEECMAADIAWAPGLPLGAEGWEGARYGKK